MVDSKVQQDLKMSHDNILQTLATSLSSTLSQANAPEINLAAVATSLANFQVSSTVTVIIVMDVILNAVGSVSIILCLINFRPY